MKTAAGNEGGEENRLTGIYEQRLDHGVASAVGDVVSLKNGLDIACDMSMLDHHFQAAEPYLGTDDFPSGFDVELEEPRFILPAAASAALKAPVATVSARSFTARRMQPREENFEKHDGGMALTLVDATIRVADSERAAANQHSKVMGVKTFS